MPSVICSSDSSHSPPLFYASFALLGHRSCLARPPFTLCSLLMFCVPPFPPYLSPSVKHTALPICSLSLSLSCTACSAVLPRPLYSQRWRVCSEEIYVGSTSGLLMCSSDSGVLCRQMGVSVCFLHACVYVVYPCVWGDMFKWSSDMG